jgi:acetoin utilization deacetylase AcuC-like enzyme
MHDDCLGHVTPPGHPEQVARLQAISAALAGFEGLDRRDAPMGTKDQVLLAHPADYYDRVAAAAPNEGWVSLDGDTHMSPGSLDAALRAVGANISAVDAVLTGNVSNAFVGCRPPGHHAETSTSMGFCLFGNVSIAAKHALAAHQLARVAIIDFDVHHGNGTQDLVWEDAGVLFVSSHQMPLYPGSGAAHETGAHGNVLNVPLQPNSSGADMRRIYEAQVFPALETYVPELILISAGFDAHRADPLANLNWSTEDFGWLTERICDVADTHCNGRIVSTLEGGYDLDALADSVLAHIQVLKERGA